MVGLHVGCERGGAFGLPPKCNVVRASGNLAQRSTHAPRTALHEPAARMRVTSRVGSQVPAGGRLPRTMPASAKFARCAEGYRCRPDPGTCPARGSAWVTQLFGGFGGRRAAFQRFAIGGLHKLGNPAVQ